MKKLFQILPGNDQEIVQPVLSIRLGERHCCFAIAGNGSRELKLLAYYTADEVNENFLVELFAAHPELNGNFFQVLVCYDYPQSSLVPLKYYRQEDEGLLLTALYGVDSNAIAISEAIEDWQLYNIYSIPREVYNWLTKRFANGNHWHQYTVTIRNNTATYKEAHLLLDFRKDDFTVLATVDHQILLEQTFLYETPGDIIYYLLRICQQFRLSQEKLLLELSGLIDKQSALYNELYQYFVKIEFRESGWTNTDHQYPAHFFTSLNDLARCAS